MVSKKVVILNGSFMLMTVQCLELWFRMKGVFSRMSHLKAGIRTNCRKMYTT